jgi:hypothetical protein
MRMEFYGNNKSIILSGGILFCSIFLFVLALAYFDRQAAEILKEENSGSWIVMICAIPVFIVTALLYRVFIRKLAPGRRLVLSVVVGIPVSLLTSITILTFLHQ